MRKQPSKWIGSLFACFGTIIGGTCLVLALQPTDEELISKFSPENRRNYEMNKEFRRKEQEKLIEIVKETSKSNRPIWDTGPIPSRMEVSTLNKNYEIFDYDKFMKIEAQKLQQNEISKAHKDVVEIKKHLGK